MTSGLFTIHMGVPFLATLVTALLDGELIPGRRYRDDPLALADVTIFLPTRRAVPALNAAFREAFGGGAAMLPRIRAIGDAAEAAVSDLDLILETAALDLRPAMPEAERLLALVRLVLRWRELVTADRLYSPSGAPIPVPNSTADALHLSADLLSLMDQAAAEEVDWSRLSVLVPEDHAAWWQLTLTFLEIASHSLPALMAETGRLSVGEFARRMVFALIEGWKARGPRGPVIVAGSTGSVANTAALMDAVRRLPEGAVVLPGLDLDSPDGIFAGFADTPAHYQSTMARLLDRLKVGRTEVVELGRPAEAAAARARLVGKALVPAEATDRWPVYAADLASDPAETHAALDGIRLVVAANEAEEALVAAVALRETLETPGARALMITTDRSLARRTVAELARFGVEAADTAGLPLPQTSFGALALLLTEVIAEGCPPVKLAALLGHPDVRFGVEPARIRPAARWIERRVLRGPRLAPTCAAFIAAVRKAGEGDDRPVAADAHHLADVFCAALEPLETAMAAARVTLADLIDLQLAALDRLTASPPGLDLPVSRAETALRRRLTETRDAGGSDLPMPGRDWPASLRALIGNELVLTPSRSARITITGPIEARLIPADRVLISGLDEGSWPPPTDTGPWLSRPMRKALGMSPPEQRIGLSAHDFASAFGCRDVVLTRSLRRGGAPTVPTRFLQRLAGLIGPERTGQLVAAGAPLLAWARALDDGPPVARVDRPAPAPPVEARPDSLRVTEIETLIRDPYAVYARRVLGLEPLPRLGETPDFATRGTLIHGVLSSFTAAWTGAWDDHAVAALQAAGAAAFDRELAAYPDVHALWWPRFAALADFVVRSFEATRSAIARHAEIDGAWTFASGSTGFTLRGRADRIDVLPDGRISIVDFKTGAAPTAAQIAAQLTPQLPLEAVMARYGAFGGLGPREAVELVHVLLKGLPGRDEVRSYDGHKDVTLTDTITEAELRLRGLVAAYAKPEKGYLSRARPFKRGVVGDYDHLARVKEWQIEDDGDGGEE